MAMMVEPKGFRGGSVVKNPPSDSVSKESTCNVGNVGLIPGLGRSPGEVKGYPLQYSSLENPMDSPWGHKESDRTEPATLTFLDFPVSQTVKCMPSMQEA